MPRLLHKQSPPEIRPCEKSQLDARVDASIAKAAPFAQAILTHIRELVHKALPNVEEAIKWSISYFMDMPGNEYLPDNEIAPSLFG